MQNWSDDQYDICLEYVDNIKQSEFVDQNAVRSLASQISLASIWNTAIPIERSTGWVMDGNHRLNAAKLMGLKCVPVIKLDYFDSRLSVFDWNDNAPFCRATLIDYASEARVLPYKSTRHIFLPALPILKIPIVHLR